MSRVNGNLFHLCSMDASMNAAGVVEGTKGLTVAERITITQAPLPRNNPDVKQALVAYSKLIAESRSGSILTVGGLDLEVLDRYLQAKEEEANNEEEAKRVQAKEEEAINEEEEAMNVAERSHVELAKMWTHNSMALPALPELESLHKSTMLWLWLS